MTLLGKSEKRSGLMPTFASSKDDESEDQPAQSMEEVLKKKREKIAQTKLGNTPESDSDNV